VDSARFIRTQQSDAEVDADDAGFHGFSFGLGWIRPPEFPPRPRSQGVTGVRHGSHTCSSTGARLSTAPTSLFGSSVAEREGQTPSGAAPLGRPQWMQYRPLPDQPGSPCNPFTGGRSSAPVLTCVSNSGACSVVSEISSKCSRREGEERPPAWPKCQPHWSTRAHEPDGGDHLSDDIRGTSRPRYPWSLGSPGRWRVV
jgi:hypothetical protein